MTRLIRNQLCFCGSGKKYKSCCLPKDTSPNIATIDAAWREIRQTEGRVIGQHLLPYAMKHFPAEMHEAWQYLLALAENFPQAMCDDLRDNFFSLWFLFHWEVYHEHQKNHDNNSQSSIGKRYLAEHCEQLSDYERKFLLAINCSHYSFYQVQDAVPYATIRLYDILLGSVHLVKEYTGSLTLKKDDIIFVRLVTVDDQSICVGMAPFIVLADYFIELLDLRDEMLQEGQLSPEILNEEAELLLLEYIDILWDAYVKPSNEIASNDNGELLQFCIVQFTLLCSAREAAYRLAPIYMRAPITETTATERVEEEEIGGAGVGGLVNIEKIKGASAEEIGREQNGAAQTIITFPWLKQVDNKYMNRLHTVLGFVRIRGNTLIVEVNSAERAKVAQELITQYLKDDAIFHSCIQAENADKITKGNQEESKLMQKSGFEVQGIVKEWAEQHWREWLDSPLPALQGKSPREAATTPEGRERLDALLSSFARMKKANPLLSAPLERLRKELGLV